jgi:putative CocE/NonD family hydrolase
VRAKGGSAIARAGTMLLMQAGAGHGGTGVLSFGPSVINARDLQLRFYDHYVKGIDNGIDREPPVRLAIQVPPDNGTKASSFLVTAEAFPLPGTQKTRFNLRSGGHANMQSGDGVLDASRPSDGNDDKFVYDPQKPVPSLGGGLCCISAPLGPFFGSGSQDQSSIEQREDVLVYTSARLTSDLAAIGQSKVRFWARSSARDTDFTAKLVDVHPDGFAQNVLDRVVRARFRAGSKLAPALIEPGKPYQYEIDLGFAGSMFKAGHRVRLDISSSNFPHLARNPNTGNDPATDNRMEVAQQTILHNTDHPSYLELSVVPNVTIPKR